ncbi:MAG: putative esterase [Bacteroidia bacterium]|jgi:predicted esterase
MQQHNLTVQKTARVYTSGNLETATEIWIVLHGYAQLASDFLETCEVLVNDNCAAVAPEGLHRFYRKGFYGDVVASWMTKEARLKDIEDYVSYLDQVVTSFVRPGQKLNILGFSQGVATACRWITEGNVEPNNLILWAGTFPSDINLESGSLKHNKTNCYLVFDENDPFRNEESWSKQLRFIDDLGIKPIIHNFKGGHKVPQDVLKVFAETILK